MIGRGHEDLYVSDFRQRRLFGEGSFGLSTYAAGINDTSSTATQYPIIAAGLSATAAARFACVTIFCNDFVTADTLCFFAATPAYLDTVIVSGDITTTTHAVMYVSGDHRTDDSDFLVATAVTTTDPQTLDPDTLSPYTTPKNWNDQVTLGQSGRGDPDRWGYFFVPRGYLLVYGFRTLDANVGRGQVTITAMS